MRKKKEYQCPYGKVSILRGVYQGSKGGKTYVPLEVGSEILGDNTLRLSQILSWKYANMSGNSVVNDLKVNHFVDFSKSFVQGSVQRVGEFLAEKEHSMEYKLPPNLGVVSHIGISRDGAQMPVCPSGWREAMCGSISFYHASGERLHTIYKACSPEYGTQTFQSLLDSEIEYVKKSYPNCPYIGIADGASANWKLLAKYTDIHILDFFHAAEYVNEAAKILFQNDENAQITWAKNTCHALKNEAKAAPKILKELKSKIKSIEQTNRKEALQVIITYFSNHLSQMNYHDFLLKGYPIGSGVIEATCKTLVKQRFSASAMKWNIDIANSLLLIRGLVITQGRWQQTWDIFRNKAV